MQTMVSSKTVTTRKALLSVPAIALGFVLGLACSTIFKGLFLMEPTHVVTVEGAPPVTPAVTPDAATEGDIFTSHVDVRIQHFVETAKVTSFPIVTDKITTHSYQTMYGTFLLPFYAHKPNMKMMEIGLGCDMGYGPGASVALWKKLFPKADLWEAEYDRKCVDKSRAKGQLDGTSTVVGDQSDIPTLERWVEETKGADFDVVIDDGGHTNTQIKRSFDVFWPKLNRGGLYFIEDLQVQHKRGYDDTRGKANMQKIIGDWTQQLLKKSSAGHEFPIPPHVSFIFCQEEACVISKAN
jgi:hypothetical protein